MPRYQGAQAMKPTQEQVIAWAQESGALIAPFISLNDTTFSPASLQDFAALAYEAGRNERAMTGKQCERCGEVSPAEIHTCTPKSKWQGLTDEEYETMAEHYVTNCYFDTLEYARAIEAKLKEKNT